MFDTHELLGADGAAVATYLRGERDGRPLADRLTPLPGVADAAVAAASARHLAGFFIATDVTALRGPLEAIGAQLRRRAELMTLVLHRAPSERPPPPGRLPAGVTLVPLHGRTPPELGAVSVAAYPAGHPDHRTDDPAAALAELRPLVDGTEGRGWGRLDASRVALRGGRAVGTAIVAGRDGTPPYGGPWLAELFRLPGSELRGLGAALLDAVLVAARDDALATVGLAVSTGNPARRPYASRGFATFATSVSLRMPGEPRRAVARVAPPD